MRKSLWSRLALGVVSTALLALWAGAAAAQTVTYQGQTIDISTLPPEQRAAALQMIQSGNLPEGMVVSGVTPAGGEAQPATEEAATEGETAEEKPEGEESAEPATEVATVTRQPGEQGSPDELKARPGPDGKVRFNFHSQPWADVLQWYADVTESSLYWHKLPEEALTLLTPRAYTLDETRDRLNMILLTKGFTILVQGDALTVLEIATIDPSLVPRIEPDDLEDHLPHDFARVRFELPADMDPAKAVEDVKVLLNPSAKVTPLLASRQIMVIDTVGNLRDVRDLLYSEQLAASSDIRPAQFFIRHRRADYISDQIMIVLGLDPSSRKEPMELQLEQQRMQLLMQMQSSGKDVASMLQQEGPPVFIAVDQRRNTVSVSAPPKEMEIVRRVIEQFDVPEDMQTGVAGGGMGDEELTTEKYQTINISPDAIVTALKEIGHLHPLTQFTTDSSSKTIFATATAEDHATIQRMLDKLDGSGRRLKVVWLSRRTPADQVAGTIQALMVGEQEDDSNSRRPYYYYSYYGDQQEESSDTGFRIQADVENNRLLLWANDSEFEEVTALLEELGAIASDDGANPNTWRVLDARTPEETAALLERLRETWGGQNPLNIHVAPPEEQPPAEETPSDETPAEEEPVADDAAEGDRLTTLREIPESGIIWLAQFVDAEPAAEEPAAEEPASDPAVAAEEPAAVETPAEDSTGDQPAAATAEAPPINITVTPDGRIIISSEDVAALDQLQDLMADLEPENKEFKIYNLYNSRASSVVINLKEYFAEELAADEDDEFYDYFFGYGGGSDKDSTATLGKRRKLRFIWDPDTNTILVQNASPAQIQVIDELMRIYDQPVGEDSVARRRTDVIEIQYSRAADIATALKEVYRDLLSSKDKEFEDQGDNDRGGGGRNVYYRFSSGSSDSKKTAPVKMAFEGALSIGVDPVSNTLIISAEEQIFESVVEIVTMLDQQARPDTVVQVHELRGAIPAADLQQALSTALSRPWQGGQPQAAQGGGDGRRGDGDGDRRRRRRRDRDND